MDAGSTQMWGQTSVPALMAPDKPQGPLATQLSPLHPPGAGGSLGPHLTPAVHCDKAATGQLCYR